MSTIGFLVDKFTETPDIPALAWRDEIFTCGWLNDAIEQQKRELSERGIGPGDPVVLRADFHPVTVAVLLALMALDVIIIPMTPVLADKSPGLVTLAAAKNIVSVSSEGDVSISDFSGTDVHEFYQELVKRGVPGLVLFTSGSTGSPKAVVHDFSLLLKKFHKNRPGLITLNFLMFDHWGGLNTLLHCLSNACLVVLPEKRTPEHICNLVECHRIELLPATPTFLNLLLISQAYKGRDLSTLKIISYGAEPMPESTLKGLGKTFPQAELRQTYGMIELGVLRAKSRDDGSLWVKIGGEGYDIRVVDGILQIKAEAAMLGYLNAPSPITEDGYFITGDRVEEDGDYLRILGRDSDLINVGGQKVFPAEVEAVLLDFPAVEDALVFGEAHPLTGKIVCADIKLLDTLSGDFDEKAGRIDIKRHCMKHLEPFKVPVKICFVEGGMYTDRLKHIRHRVTTVS